MRRALLLFNPEATSVSPPVRDVIAHALAAELKLEVAETKRRHHATHLASGAAHEGFDLVVCLGGDGTLNEVVNGLVGSPVSIVPLPGGGTNVFARSLGLPKDPIEATSVILERIASGAQPRRINLGKVNDRMFAFCAGIGFDAAVVRRVEQRFRLKQTIGESLFIAQALRTFFLGYPRREPLMSVTAGDRTIDDVRAFIVCNSDPYTFLGSRPFRLCPAADPLLRLDALAVRSMKTLPTLRLVFAAFGKARHASFPSVDMLHDVGSIEIECARPLPYQVDGDYAGEATRFRFEAAPDSLSVLA